jgi:hypothetical protein
MLNLHKLDGFVNIQKNAAHPVSIMRRFHKTSSCHIIRSCRFSFRPLLHQRGEARLSMLLRVCVPELSSGHHGLSDRTGGCGGRRGTPRRCRLAAEATATATGGPLLPTWRSRVTRSRTTEMEERRPLLPTPPPLSRVWRGAVAVTRHRGRGSSTATLSLHHDRRGAPSPSLFVYHRVAKDWWISVGSPVQNDPYARLPLFYTENDIVPFTFR